MLTKFGISRQIFLKFVKIKFRENPSSRIGADICGETDRRMYEQTDGRTGAFVDYMKAPNVLRYSIVFLYKYITDITVWECDRNRKRFEINYLLNANIYLT